MKNNNITEKDLAVKDAIVTYIAQHGYAPSVRELCKLLNLSSTSTVHSRLKRLKELGIIETDSEMSPRAIRVVGYKFVKVD